MQFKLVQKLQRELTNQIKSQWDEFPFISSIQEDDHLILRAKGISRNFEYNDGKAEGQHTKEHGKTLNESQVRWLLTQADDQFEKVFKEINSETIECWRLK